MTSATMDVGALSVSISAPDLIWAEMTGRPPTGGEMKARGDVHYSVESDGDNRFSLERDAGGLCRGATAAHVMTTLARDLSGIVERRRPGTAVLQAGAVMIGDRAVLVLDEDLVARSRSLRALERAGASVVADGLVAIHPSGRVTGLSGEDRASTDKEPVPRLAVIVTSAADGTTGEAALEVRGVRAVLGLLDRVLPDQRRSSHVRSLTTTLANHVVELRLSTAVDTDLARRVVEQAASADLPEAVAPPTTNVDANTDDPSTDAASAPAPARFSRFTDFLDPEDHARLLELAIEHEADFAPSSVVAEDGTGNEDRNIRRSTTANEAEVRELFERTFTPLLPLVRKELGIDRFQLAGLEVQLTAHGDGDHFTLHSDNGGPEVATRVVSGVYYFNRTPRRFTGGELRLFSTVDRNGSIEPTDSFVELEPADNSIVFFPSETFHEVRPVHADSDEFADRRFTVVMWARRQAPVDLVFQGDADTLTDRQRDLVPSLTEDGFRIISTPEDIQARLLQHFTDGRDGAVLEPESDTFLPTGIPEIIPLGELGTAVHTELQSVHEDWCGQSLVPSAAYGMRVYGEGQTLRRHCDIVRTHVISSVVHVAADLDEPWPMVIEDRDGNEQDIVLEPGQTLLYESARLPHGRPTPMPGRHYASVFLHYHPLDWIQTLEQACTGWRPGPGNH